MKKISGYIWIIVLFQATLAVAQTPEAYFEQGNAFYTDGRYQEAIDSYMHIVESDQESAAVYYNLANAHYKLNNVAPANYYYEKALQLAPYDTDIRNNATFAENMRIDTIVPLPENTFNKWFNNILNTLTVDGWAYTTVILIIVFVLLFLGYYFTYASTRKRVFFVTAFSALFLGIGSLVFSYAAFAKANNDNPAIVFANQSEVRSEPNLSSSSAFTLHEGSKVNVLEAVKNWKRIQLIDGKTGWIPAEDIREL
ncbi:MAG: tetratricopeptide repeat protein [Dokdonia sp.]|jgi:tetratricopeptide (TPR) repeat protein